MGQADRVRDIFAEAAERAAKLGVALKLPHLPGEDPAADQPHKNCFVAWRDFFLGSDGYLRPRMSTARKYARLSDMKDFDSAWQAPFFVEQRRLVNAPGTTPGCRYCYQSWHTNWNRREAFIQTGLDFAPKWEGRP